MSSTQTPLKVVVAGAGLVGLSVAAILRRQGHQVEVVYLFVPLLHSTLRPFISHHLYSLQKMHRYTNPPHSTTKLAQGLV
jgi:pyruvate/2-oxoglutarate dehydrogenase complex dihydrolipoamide dehydrogenase (E3) component